MDRLKMHTPNLADENFQKLSELFPNAVTETINEDGEIVRAVDADVLRQEISTKVVEGNQERYQFTWPDKRKSIRLANQPIAKTLRLDRNKSVGKDGSPGKIDSENIYIEGDNLDVLKLLQETYLNKIKVIYIDPPYNTGNNLIYKNDFSLKSNQYKNISGQTDENNNILVPNLVTNGRFHTDWLNMIYPRLKLAKDLIKDDGYIVVSIDDYEIENLKKIMDEIFYEKNFIGTIVTRCNPQGRNKKNIDPVHEYYLVYAKNIDNLPNLTLEDNERGEYRTLLRSGTNSYRYQRPYRFYPILVKNNKLKMISPDEYKKIYVDGQFNEKFLLDLEKKYKKLGYKVIFPKSRNGQDKVWNRKFDRVFQEIDTYIYENGKILYPTNKRRTPQSLWTDNKYSNVQNGTNHLKNLFGRNAYFDYSKSLFTIQDIISLNSQQDDIILDFFSGSGTTAEAVLNLNALDGLMRKFILVQINDPVKDPNFKTICDIGEERIKRAGTNIKKETGADIDYGYRVFKVDSSNMKDVYYNPSEISQEQLSVFTDNIKEDRTPEDLLIQIMLDLGIPLSSKIDEIEIDNKKVFSLDNGFLLACFDKDITDETVTEIAKMKPYYAVFRDSSMKDDSVMVNFDQIFEFYSPKTQRKVL